MSSAANSSVYNSFYEVTATGLSTGYYLDAAAPNENRFIACRANSCDRGFEFNRGNNNNIIACACDECGIGVYMSSSLASGNASNRVIGCRFEGCSTGIQANSTSVVNFEVIGGHFSGNTKDVQDDGTRSRIEVKNTIMLPDMRGVPINPFPEGETKCNIYVKNDNFVWQFNDGATIKYFSIDLTQTGAQSIAYGTTDPS
jgi:hypothetical protein